MLRYFTVPTIVCMVASGCATQLPSQQELGYTIYYDPSILCFKPGEKEREPFVRVMTADGGYASGFVVGKDRVLTAAHVVSDAVSVGVQIHSEYRQAHVLVINQEDDLALLHVSTGDVEAVSIASSILDILERVWSVSFPLAGDQVVELGYVLETPEDQPGKVFASAIVNAGSSGGGLLHCDNGEFVLVGMIRGNKAYKGNKKIRILDVSIHTPAERIKEFIARHGVTRT